jgi:hypothetical protein
MYNPINSQGVDNDRLFNVRCFEYKSFMYNPINSQGVDNDRLFNGVYRIVHKALVLKTSYIEQTVIVNTLRVYRIVDRLFNVRCFEYKSFMYNPVNSRGVDNDRLFNVRCFKYKSFMYDPINSQGVDNDHLFNVRCFKYKSFMYDPINKLLYSKHLTLNRQSLSTP